ncbi:hypothetical protein [Hydrogenophaga sp. 5NK40-0174]|uniref:hypothetical protein n=1 Tax=Hydrogenophaga sp. 5NK40-0174 TaxID=3127649 RepID=UPI0031047356
MASETPPDAKASQVSERYLRPLPEGVIRWVAGVQAAEQLHANERQVFQYILLGPSQQRVDPDALAQATGLARASVGKALFALNRDGSIQVDARAEDIETEERIWNTLDQHIKAMSSRHADNAIVVADPDGLCVASANADPELSQRLASGHALQDIRDTIYRVALYLGERPFWLASVGPLKAQDTGWVMIARCLEALRPRQHLPSAAAEQA